MRTNGATGENFNPRPPCGGRPCSMLSASCRSLFQSTSPVWRTTKAIAARERLECISIHVPRVEDDSVLTTSYIVRGIFQSTSPVWRTTEMFITLHGLNAEISIHVPRVEDDMMINTTGCEQAHFNPRPPCGGRPVDGELMPNLSLFQSTSPVWRTTSPFFQLSKPREYFNPRPPCGGRLVFLILDYIAVLISIHVPRVEDDAIEKFYSEV